MHQIKLPNQPGWPEPISVSENETASYYEWLEALQHSEFLWTSNGDERDIPGGNFPKLIAFSSTGLTDDEFWHQELGDTELESDSYLFGILRYELPADLSVQNVIEQKTLFSKPFKSSWFKPEGLIIWAGGNVHFLGQAMSLSTTMPATNLSNRVVTPLTSLTSLDAYKAQFQSVKDYIKSGDTYELNLCIPYSGIAEFNNPSQVYKAINGIAPAPFSVWFKAGSQHVFSASPERFLQKHGSRLISQPIKGTAPRHPDPLQDQTNKSSLESSEKERAENLMIVDMVRHDLASVSIPGSVMVDELIKCYSFSHVHQLISTISSQLIAAHLMANVIQKTFPMGSMTGAPKERTMELIAKIEPYQRGWFSGSLFYRTPENNWDFNVVIRSLFYDHSTKQMATWAGSAITWDADAQTEFNECQTKTRHWQQALSQFQ